MAGGESPPGRPNATIGPAVAPTEFNQSPCGVRDFVRCWPLAAVILDRVGTAAIEGATDERWFVAVVYRRADAAAVNAIARGSQHSTIRAISSQASPPGEAEYVGRVLTALIAKGEIGANHIAKTTARLREVWRETDPSTHSDKKG
jgi:hypothetical protein